VRSLWRIIAARWLGGRASETLTGDTALLDLLTPPGGDAAFAVRRQSAVSYRAMMSQQDPAPPEREDALGHTVEGEPSE
jgi:hypothetical protein